MNGQCPVDSARSKTGLVVRIFCRLCISSPAPNQQNETQRHLDYYQARTDPRSSAAPNDTGGIGTFNRAGEIDLAGLHGGNQPEQGAWR